MELNRESGVSQWEAKAPGCVLQQAYEQLRTAGPEGGGQPPVRREGGGASEYAPVLTSRKR